MATKTKWFFFWLISGSFLAGILAVCFVVSAAIGWVQKLSAQPVATQ